jgi:signal transduction histidine kinase
LEAVGEHWRQALFWAFLVALVNLLPVRVNKLYFIFDAPIILGAAFLYPPPVASLIGVLATIDIRELRGDINPSYAVFNRLQTGLSVFLAGAAFHSIAGQLKLEAWPTTILGALAALLIDYVVNVTLVLGGYIERGEPLRAAARNLHVGNPIGFLGTYLGYGLLALFLAHLFNELGPWSVVAFLVPIVVAQQMLARTQQLELVTEDLRSRERLLQSLFDRAIDERRDERLRIAGDLHDSVLQSLTKIWMLGSILKRDAGYSLQASADLEELVMLADRSIVDLRKLMKEMRQSPIGASGLVPTLDGLVRDLRLESQIPIEMEAPSDLDLPPRIQVVAYQVAREGLVNAMRHAEAKKIEISLRCLAGFLELRIQDEGRGFDASQPADLHFGLRLLQERVARCQGTVEISSEIGRGTQLRVCLPVTQERVPVPEDQMSVLDLPARAAGHQQGH